MSDAVVLKFGGTSLGTLARVRRAAARIRHHVRRGRRVVVVVSARGRTTDRLARAAAGLAPAGYHNTDVVPAAPSGAAVNASITARELDRLLATGEDRSAALLALACARLGLAARSLRGGEAGIRVEGEHGHGQIREVDAAAVRCCLEEGIVPIVCGFQGEREDGETLTLSRGGSDTTAVALAAALADRPGEVPCHIVTDVPAVYDRDPARHPDAVPFGRLNHAALVALTESGARVIHPEAARLAEHHRVPLLIYSYRAPITGAPRGTRVDASWYTTMHDPDAPDSAEPMVPVTQTASASAQTTPIR